MKKLTIFAEGGAVANENTNVQTVGGVETLRRSISRLLTTKLTNKDLDVDIELRGGISNAIQTFKANADDETQHCFLLIDSDVPPNQLHTRITQQALTAYQHLVFFMVQEMEAWILSQPDKIEECYKHLKFTGNTPIAEGAELKDINVEYIKKPSELLAIILPRYFVDTSRDKPKKKKYASKLKDASELLNALNVERLYTDISEVKRLIDTLNAV
jgi:hypothetical protein